MLKKLYKPLLITAAALAVYALLGFFLLPYVIKNKLPSLITEQTQYPAKLSDVKFNPFKLQLSLDGFELKDKQKEPFVQFGKLFIDLGAIDSLSNLALVIESLRLDGLNAQITAFKDGHFNFSDLIPKDDKKPEPESKPLPFLLKSLELNQGSLTWLDKRLTKPEPATLTPINLSLNNLSLKQDNTAILHLSSDLQFGGHLDVQMDLSPKPLAAKGKIQVKALELDHLWALVLADKFNFKILQGSSDLSLNYQFSLPKDQVELKLSDGQFSSHKLVISEQADPKPLLSIPELSINGIDFNLAEQTLHIQAIDSKAMDLNLQTAANGELNYQHLFSPKGDATPNSPTPTPTQKADTAKPWAITIAKLGLHELQAGYESLSPDFALKTKLNGLEFSLTDYQLQAGGQVHMSVKTGQLDTKALQVNDLTLQADSPSLNAQFDALHSNLSNFQFDSAADKLQITNDDSNLRLENLSLRETASPKPLIAIPSIDIKGTKLNLAEQQVSIGQVLSSGAKLRAWLSKSGEINYASLSGNKSATKAPQSKPEAPKADSTKPWLINLADLAITNYQIDFEDQSHAKPINMQLAKLDFKAQNFTTAKGKKLPFSLVSSLNKEGKLQVKGQATLEPLNTNLDVNLNNLALLTFQPYLNDVAKVDIIDGNINTALKLNLSNDAKKDLQLRVKGSSQINQLVTRDQILNKDLIKWQALKLEGIDFNLSPMQVNISNVLLEKPYARVTIRKDQTLNFSDVVVKNTAPSEKSSTPPPPTTKSTAKTAPPQYKIDAITIAGATSDFADYSLILPFVVELNDLNGKINSVSSDQKKHTDFALAGKVFDLSPMDLKGDFSPDFSDLDIGMHFKGMPLPFISPYMVEFAGYKIEKGKMSLDLLYKIQDHKLSAQNNLVLDQLTLGEKVENPKATSLPLNLAITLLKDADGKININLPITGSLDDPQFSVGTLVFDAFVNVITKAVSAPFKALGSLLGSDVDLSHVIFKEGRDGLEADEAKKLAELAKALTQKPALSIEIKGLAYTKQDWPELQDRALLDQLKANRSAELKAEGKQQLAEYIKLDDKEAARILADLYIQKFPTRAKRSMFGTPELIGSDKDFQTVARKEMAAIIPPDSEKLSALAGKRARSIAQQLIKEGKIGQERIFILDSTVQEQATTDGVIGELSLKVQ